MSAAHTPGPWVAELGADGAFAIEADGQGIAGGLLVLASRSPHQLMAEQMHANARLIAAAPDLLAALQGIDEAYCRAGAPLTRDERNEDRQRLIAARAAIAKATGGTQ